MKIRNLFIAVMTLVLTVTGCSRVDNPTADDSLKFVFEIADKGGFGADTKAVKTAWADEDMVYILFKPTGAEECLVSKNGDKKYPIYATTTYSYDQDAWDLVYNVEVGDLGTGGKYYAIHHRGSIDMDDKTGMGKDCFPLNSYAGGELLSYVGDYTVDGNTVNLGVIRMVMDSRIFQVSIGMQLWLNTTPETSFWLNDFYLSNRETLIDGDHDEWIEESVFMSIYIDETLDNPGWVSLQPGAVSVDLTDEKIFVYNQHEDYKENATAVLNYDDDSDINDVSFYFADSDGFSTPDDFYTFIVKRYHSEYGEYYYPEDLRSFNLKVNFHYKDRSLKPGNAYRLPADGWKL